MYDVWLCLDEKSEEEIKPWIGTSDIEPLIETSDIDDLNPDDYFRNPNYHFRIQGENGVVSVHAGKEFKWKLVVAPAQDPTRPQNARVGFVHVDKCENQSSYIQNFQMGMEIGENVFHLIVHFGRESYHLKLDPSDTVNKFYPIGVYPESHEPVRLAGLVDGETYFTFCIGQEWYVPIVIYRKQI